MQKLTKEEFYAYMESNIGYMNAEIGFWLGFYYEKYKSDQCTLEEAFKDLYSMRNYNGWDT